MLALLLNPHLTTALAVLATSADPMTWLINFGAVGVVLVLLVTGQLRTKAEVAAIQKIAEERYEEIQRKNQALDDLVNQITHGLLPQLTRTTEVLNELSRKIDDIERRNR